MPEPTPGVDRVHPVAALFPMLPDDELDDLAEDIKANGLLHPIVLDRDGVLIDGRNRLDACRRAGVEPTYVLIDGLDPVAYILSSNVARRHLNKSQRAMAVALARVLVPNTERPHQQAVGDAVGVSQARVSQAETVLRWAPEYADAVLAGASLDAPYAEALRRKRAPEPAERAAAFEEEERRRVAEEERRRRAIALQIEEIGPEIPLPPRSTWPDLAVALPAEAAPATPKPAEGPDLAEQQDYLRELNALVRAASHLRSRAVVTRGWWLEGHAAAVRSAVSHVVADALAVAEAHNAAAGPHLRMVE